MFYKIKALHVAGINIILHCFHYGREEAKALHEFCAEVYYYKRYKGLQYHIVNKPYIVASRSNKQLLSNLLSDNFPILFEGLHCTYFLNHPKLKDRLKIVRTHNVEHEYYMNLACISTSRYKKLFFQREANKLKHYEPVLQHADHILAISNNDALYFEKMYGKTIHIPAFHPGENINIATGKGDYALYHGNLAVPENIYAAEFLVNKVFSNIDYPLIIAGRNPSEYLVKEIARYEHIALKTNLSDAEITKLIQNAQLNILPTFQKTGLKLKLLASLFSGRFCIVNENMVENTGLENLCIVKNTASEMQETIHDLNDKIFQTEDVENRKKQLEKFKNEHNAKAIIDKCLS